MDEHKKHLDSILAKCQNGRNMLLLSKNKYEKIVQYLKLGTGASYRFKSWIQRRRFQLLQLPDEDQTEVLVVPKQDGMSMGYVRVLHENQIYGKVRDIHVCVLNHGSYTQTLQSVSDLYYDISKDYISEFVRRCDCCQTNSTSDGISNSDFQSSSTMKASPRPLKMMNKVASYFLQDVSVNIIDMRLKPSNEFYFIGHAEDQFSNFSVLFPLKNDSSREIAKNLKKYFLSYFGPPKNLSSGDTPNIAKALDEVTDSWKGNSLSFALDGIKIQIQDAETSATDEVATFIQDSICLIAAEGYSETEWSDWLPEIMLKLNVARRPSASQAPYTVVFGQPASVLSEFDEFLPGRDGGDLSAQESPHNTMKDTEMNRHEEQSHDTSNTSLRDDPNPLTPMFVDVHVKQEPASDEESGRAVFATIKNKSIGETLSVSGKKRNLHLGLKVKENTSEYSVGKTQLPCDNSEIKQEDTEDAEVPCESSCNVPVDSRREDDGSIESPHQDNGTYNINSHHHGQEVGDTGTSVQTPPVTVPWLKVSKMEWHSPRQASDVDASRIDASKTAASVPDVSRRDGSKTTDGDPSLIEDCDDLMTRPTAGNGDETNSEDLGHCVEIDIAEEDSSWDPCAEQSREGHQMRKPIHLPPLETQEMRRKLTKEDVCFVERLKRQNPILILSEIREHLRIERGVEVHVSTISRAMKKKSNSYQEAASLNSQDESQETKLSPSEHGSNGRHTENTERKQLMHKNFLPQDEMFLTYLLHKKPYLTNEEVREQLERQRNLSISLHYLNKKISGMVAHRKSHENQLAHRQGRVDSSRNRDASTMVGSPSGTETSVTLQGQHMMLHQKQPSVMKKWTSVGTNGSETIMGENSLKQTAVPQSKSSPVHDEQLRSRNLSRKMMMPTKRKIHDSLFADLPDSPRQVLENGRNNNSKKKPQNFHAGCESVNQHVTNISVDNCMSPELNDEDTELMVQSSIPSPVKKEVETDQESFFGYETRNDMPHRNGKLQPADLDFLECLKRQNPNITLTEMKYRLLDERNLDVHVSSVCRALKKLVYTQEEMEPNYLVYINSQEAGGSAEYQVDNEDDSLLNDSQFDECSEPQVAYSDEYVQSSNSDNFSHRISSGNLYSGSPDYTLQEEAEDERHSGNLLKLVVDARMESELDGLDVTNNKKLTLKDMQLIRQLKTDDPSITLRNMKACLLKENGKDVHLSTISRALKKMNGSLNHGKTGDVIDLTL
ncbi:uncharacterized protein [Haliotis asinina]|uniref:uncharacterized protein n=1 Tax=Haliotis asinina TaxID=109174 RepID=UPI00353225D9